MKKAISYKILILFFVLLIQDLSAQITRVKGRITDGKTGESLALVTVFFDESSISTQTNEKGWPKRIQSINPEFLKKNNFKSYIFIINTQSPYSFTPIWQPISLQASRHYAYAFQWFGLSLTLLIAYFSTHIRRL